MPASVRTCRPVRASCWSLGWSLEVFAGQLKPCHATAGSGAARGPGAPLPSFAEGARPGGVTCAGAPPCNVGRSTFTSTGRRVHAQSRTVPDFKPSVLFSKVSTNEVYTARGNFASHRPSHVGSGGASTRDRRQDHVAQVQVPSRAPRQQPVELRRPPGPLGAVHSPTRAPFWSRASERCGRRGGKRASMSASAPRKITHARPPRLAKPTLHACRERLVVQLKTGCWRHAASAGQVEPAWSTVDQGGGDAQSATQPASTARTRPGWRRKPPGWWHQGCEPGEKWRRVPAASASLRMPMEDQLVPIPTPLDVSPRASAHRRAAPGA